MDRPTQTVPDISASSIHFRTLAHKNSLKEAPFPTTYRLQPNAPKSSAREDLGCATVDDSDQISVFDAENYFSESTNQKENNKRVSFADGRVDNVILNHDVLFSSANSRISSASSAADGYGRNYRTRSFHATPTASSEASWNSQTGLLANPPGSMAVSLKYQLPSDKKLKNGGSTGNRKWLQRCPCTGKKSIQVLEDKQTEPPKTPSIINPSRQIRSSITTDLGEIRATEKIITSTNFRRLSLNENQFSSKIGNHHHQFNNGTTNFSFPILNQTSKIQVQLSKGLPTADEPPRESLEVFQPPTESGGRRALVFPASPMSRITATDDDAASDASSDLFEIESFSTQATSGPMYRRRDSLDEATRRFCRQSLDEPVTPSVAATECYEPSEASIDWSVTTAEGFDRASISNFSISASQIGDVAVMRQKQSWVEGSGGDGGSRRRSSGGNGGGGGGLLMMSCRSEKAVNVMGPKAVKYGGGGQNHDGVFPPRVVGGGPPLPLISTSSMRNGNGRPYQRCS